MAFNLNVKQNLENRTFCLTDQNEQNQSLEATLSLYLPLLHSDNLATHLNTLITASIASDDGASNFSVLQIPHAVTHLC